MSIEYREIPPGSVPTIALLLTRPSSLFRGTGASRALTSAGLTHLLGYSRPPPSFRDVSGRNHKGTWAGCIVSANAPPARNTAKLRMNHVRCSATETCRCQNAGPQERQGAARNPVLGKEEKGYSGG